jgi:hypothetical protein
MDIVLTLLAIAWVLGWIKEMAFVERRMRIHGISYPNNAVRYAAPIVLFFTWPYSYFYGKA